MADWQPIETAPRNEPVLVFSPDATEPQIMLAVCYDFGDETSADLEWFDVWIESAPAIDVGLTHWQPLPASPTKAQR